MAVTVAQPTPRRRTLAATFRRLSTQSVAMATATFTNPQRRGRVASTRGTMAHPVTTSSMPRAAQAVEPCAYLTFTHCHLDIGAHSVLTFLTCVSPHSRMIATSGNLELDSGSISTNGHNGYTGSSHAGGGGAGGSVWITATAVTGTGSIVSNGGSTSSYSAGGGTTPSHGRLALYTAPSASHHVPLLQAEVVASPST